MKSRQTLTNDMTNGSVARQILAFAAPLFASNLLQAVYNVVDMIVVGHVIGDVGLAAVNIGGSLLSALQFIAVGFGSAGSIQISQLVGARKNEKLSPYIGTLFSLLFLCSATLTILCLLLRNLLLAWLNTPPEAWDMTMQYAVTCICGLVFIYGYNVVSAILRGMGDSRHPFLFISIAATSNVLLDCLFVAALGLGALGAALATVLAQGMSFIISIIFLYRNKDRFHFDFKFKSFTIRREALFPLIRLGVPMAIQTASVQISKLVIDSFINACGVVASAVTGITANISSACNLAANAIGTASSTMVGQNLGAGKMQRVNQTMRVAYTAGLAIFLLFASVNLFFPRFLYGLFTSDEETLSVCMEFIPCAILVFLGQALRAPNMALINGSGNSRLNFLVAVIDGIIARTGFGLLLGIVLKMSYRGFWYGNAIAGFMPVIIGICYHASGRWKKRRLDI